VTAVSLGPRSRVGAIVTAVIGNVFLFVCLARVDENEVFGHPERRRSATYRMAFAILIHPAARCPSTSLEYRYAA
jgi:hypothetical protein